MRFGFVVTTRSFNLPKYARISKLEYFLALDKRRILATGPIIVL